MFHPLIHDERGYVQAVLIAGQLLAENEGPASDLILDALGIGTPADVVAEMDDLARLIGEYGELLDRRRLAEDDPRLYIDLHEDRPVHDSLVSYSEWRCAELDADLQVLAADARRGAQLIAERALILPAVA